MMIVIDFGRNSAISFLSLGNECLVAKSQEIVDFPIDIASRFEPGRLEFVHSKIERRQRISRHAAGTLDRRLEP
jgi:hypothetical protein